MNLKQEYPPISFFRPISSKQETLLDQLSQESPRGVNISISPLAHLGQSCLFLSAPPKARHEILGSEIANVTALLERIKENELNTYYQIRRAYPDFRPENMRVCYFKDNTDGRLERFAELCQSLKIYGLDSIFNRDREHLAPVLQKLDREESDLTKSRSTSPSRAMQI